MDFVNNCNDIEARKKNQPKEGATIRELVSLDPLLKIMFLKRLIYKYWPTEGHFSTDPSRSIRLKFENYKNNFPSTHWEIGKSYEIPDNVKYLCETKLKDKVSKAFVYLIEDDLNFLLAEKDSMKPNSYRILLKDRIYHVDFSVNEKNIVCSNMFKKTSITLKFERVIQASSISHILKNNSDNKKSEIGKYLQSILKTLQIDLPKEFDMQVMEANHRNNKAI